MARYEDGVEFWEIACAGASLVITSGKLGSQGKTAVTRCVNARAAVTQHDVLVAKKLRSRFRLVALAPSPADDGRLAALESAIDQDPYDRDAYSVYGDVLAHRGDPRGELIALQIAEEARPDSELRVAIRRHMTRYVGELMGPLADFANNTRSNPFTWRFGFIHRVRLALLRDFRSMFGALLQHPSGRFLAELELHSSDNDVTPALALLATRELPSLRSVVITSWDSVGSLGVLRRAARRLSRLRVETMHARAPAPARTCLRSIAAGAWPELRSLELHFGEDDSTFEDLAPLIREPLLPSIERLLLRGTRFVTAICSELIASPLAARLAALDLGHSEVTDEDVELLLRYRRRFGKLRELVIPHARLSASKLVELRNSVERLHDAPASDDSFDALEDDDQDDELYDTDDD